jgi:oligopeptide transport system substrate-binding protein
MARRIVRRMRFGAASVSVFVVGLALWFGGGSGCGRPETRVEHGNRHQILHFDNVAEPQDLDPHIVTGVPEHRLLTALFEGLVSEDPQDLAPQPGVAHRWERTDDQRTYTFYLRTNALWSNGERVTALDFVRSFRRMLAPTMAAEYAYMLYVMKNAEAFNAGRLTNFNDVGVQALDETRLRIELHAPTPYFLWLLTHYSWFPIHEPSVAQHGPVHQRGSRWTRPGRLIGNGPFTLAEWKVNHVIRVKKNLTYWDAETVRLQEIHFYPWESGDTSERAFRSGQSHYCYQIPPNKTQTYRDKYRPALHIDPNLATYFYLINVTNPPMNDRRVRQALALGIDRESLVRNVTRGEQLPAYHFTPPNTAGYTARGRLQGDLARAQRLLAEAGYPGGRGMAPIEIHFNTMESHRAIAEAIQQMWKQNLGVDARLVNQEWKVFQDTQRTGRYQVSRYGWNGDYPDPNSFLDMWVTGGGNNRAFWSHPEYDRLLHAAGRTADAARRFELFQQAEIILMEELPIIPLYFYTRVYALHPAVQGWFPTILDTHPYKYLWLDQTKN